MMTYFQVPILSNLPIFEIDRIRYIESFHLEYNDSFASASS